jgi:hypothetical protein
MISKKGFLILLCFICGSNTVIAQAPNTPMPWAYAINTPGVEIDFAFNVPRTVPTLETFTNHLTGTHKTILKCQRLLQGAESLLCLRAGIAIYPTAKVDLKMPAWQVCKKNTFFSRWLIGGQDLDAARSHCMGQHLICKQLVLMQLQKKQKRQLNIFLV